MSGNSYHLISHWRVQSTVDEVSAILKDAPDLPRWWPAVYLDVQEEAPGDGRGVGKIVRLHTKGWLPYTLRWRFRVIESRDPYGYTIEALDDLVGRGTWVFAQDGEWVDMTYDWQVRVDKPLLRAVSFLLKPVFAANHHWAMRQGERSLCLELARRHAATPEERRQIPTPLGPTNLPSGRIWLVIGALAVMAAAFAYLT